MPTFEVDVETAKAEIQSIIQRFGNETVEVAVTELVEEGSLRFFSDADDLDEAYDDEETEE